MMTLQLLSKRGMRVVLVLVVAWLTLLPAEGYGQAPENSDAIYPWVALKDILSGPCGKYFGIDSCSGESFEGLVTEVSDPDRLTVRLASDKTVHVHLAGVKVAEEFAGDARQLLSSLLLTEPINGYVFCGGQIPKGRLVGSVWVSGVEVNLELIRQGFAYFNGSGEGLDAYTKCTYRLAQEKAKAERRGLWSKDTEDTPK